MAVSEFIALLYIFKTPFFPHLFEIRRKKKDCKSIEMTIKKKDNMSPKKLFVLMVWLSTAEQSIRNVRHCSECFPNDGCAKVPRVTENIHRWSSASLLHSKEVQKGRDGWREEFLPLLAAAVGRNQ